MKSYLEKVKGEKVGVIRAGMPKEVYFEAVVKEVLDDAVVFDDDGKQVAVPLDKLLLVGPPEEGGPDEGKKAGFV